MCSLYVEMSIKQVWIIIEKKLNNNNLYANLIFLETYQHCSSLHTFEIAWNWWIWYVNTATLTQRCLEILGNLKIEYFVVKKDDKTCLPLITNIKSINTSFLKNIQITTQKDRILGHGGTYPLDELYSKSSTFLFSWKTRGSWYAIFKKICIKIRNFDTTIYSILTQVLP